MKRLAVLLFGLALGLLVATGLRTDLVSTPTAHDTRGAAPTARGQLSLFVCVTGKRSTVRSAEPNGRCPAGTARRKLALPSTGPRGPQGEVGAAGPRGERGASGPVSDPSPALGLLYAAISTRNSRPAVIVTAGSSTTAGAWPGLFATALQSAYPVTGGQPATVTLAQAQPPLGNGLQVVNAGIGGTTSANYLTPDSIAKIATLAPSVVFHMVGANDFAEDVAPTAYKASVQSAISRIDAQAPGPVLHVLVQSYQRFDPPVLDGTAFPWSDYGDALRSIAAGQPQNVVFIDLSDVFARAGVPSSDPFDLVSSDQIHPTQAGADMIAQQVLRDLTAG